VTDRRTNRPARRGLVAALLAVGVGSALAIGGCSAGLVTQTSSQVPPVQGANTDAGPIALRNLSIEYNGPQGYAAGSDAPLAVRIFNNGLDPVTLVGVSSDKASSVTLTGSPEVITPTASPTVAAATSATSAAPTGSAEPTGTAGPTGSVAPTGTAGPTATTTAAPAPAASLLSITIPGQSYVLLVRGESGGNLVLRGLTTAIAPGESTRMTFTFANGTTASLDVPLVPTSNEPVTRDPAVVPAETSAAE
jgi:copper(I)-binding protein